MPSKPFTAHTDASYWHIDPDRRLAMGRDGQLRAYAELHAEVGEPLQIEWAPGPVGVQRVLLSGPVRFIREGSDVLEQSFDEQLRQLRRGR